MDRIGIIQLSDLQFGSKHTFGYPSNISRKITDDIDLLARKLLFTPLYIILSGDITETAHGNEFVDARQQIINIAEGLSIDNDSILTVCGNHDVNWELSKIASVVGDNSLKFNNYYKYVEALTDDKEFIDDKYYPIICDHRAGIIFLLLNSCEKESDSCHIGYIDPDKLIETLSSTDGIGDVSNYIKIAVLHHRLDTTICDKRSAIENATEIEAILINNGYQIVLTGHVHQNIVHEVIKDNNRVIYSGTGSTGVNYTQRDDGIQNQYCVHIIDRKDKSFETIWRAYNPQKRTKYGLGGWTIDNTGSEEQLVFPLPCIKEFINLQGDLFEDINLRARYNITSNPFTFSNAEKISSKLLLDLFVSDETRHMGAKRLTGDSIIRGPRGSGKTMLLRYLHIFGSYQFNASIEQKQTAECLPVFVNLSRIHHADIGNSAESIFSAADRLIYESVVEAIHEKAQKASSELFKNYVYHMDQRLKNLQTKEGTLISKLGMVIQDTLSSFFSHVLLLIDEVAPVFPKEFFADIDNGFLRWMNSIRNSGPYFTRVAVYPNDVSDILNEERFGTMVNLGYDIRSYEDYSACRRYFVDIVNKYLLSVSLDKNIPVKINDIIYVAENDPIDALEQLIYASDGSSRRFLSLIDKCLGYGVSHKSTLLSKEDIFNVIKEFSVNLLSGYSQSEQELAKSIAKACKKQSTFRFRLPGLSGIINPLYGKREELNIVKLAQVGSGRRGSTYEFTYPYCIMMEIHTHNIRDSRKVYASRDYIIGEWISQVTTIKKENLDYFNSCKRCEGYIDEIDGDIAIIRALDGEEYLAEDTLAGLKIRDNVSFIINDTQALALQKISE